MWTKNQIASMVAAGAILGAAPVAAEVFSGRGTSMGGAGAAGGDYTYSALINPATATNFKENDDFAFTVDVGLLANDVNDFIDSAENLTDYLDEIEEMYATQDDADYLLDQLQQMDRGRLTLDVGAQLTIAIPNSAASALLFVRESGFVATELELAEEDVDFLSNFGDRYLDIDINNPPSEDDLIIDGDDLMTEAAIKGYRMQEIGIALAREFTFGETLVSLGITPKHQRVETFEYSEVVADFEGDDVEYEDYALEHTNFNVDLGATINWGALQGGLSVRNALAQEYETLSGDMEIQLEPLVTAGFGYTGEIFTVLADVDLTTTELFDGAGATQNARLGIEMDLFDWAQLRVGYRHDMEGTYEDALTAGIGFSPFDVLHLHVSAIQASDNTYGAAVQFGIEL
ncbi:conjugal transfer protein TraF [Microbulbifer bruguierae]|uniref:Conjugal transfer protein TraF n=1 Tax=Microbulbifer bruguierae TaxID=3029061 RepID=A0ABY8N965_9GAMM|nr:conjugal transfer protein TraF [Microbulbifer bruguierae]WGL15450.1 conjugal transfer protein TraF [Microbulbifer bruguierae]